MNASVLFVALCTLAHCESGSDAKSVQYEKRPWVELYQASRLRRTQTQEETTEESRGAIDTGDGYQARCSRVRNSGTKTDPSHCPYSCCYNGKCGTKQECEESEEEQGFPVGLAFGIVACVLISAASRYGIYWWKANRSQVEVHRVFVPANALPGQRIWVSIPSSGQSVEITVPEDPSCLGGYIMISLPKGQQPAPGQQASQAVVVGRAMNMDEASRGSGLPQPGLPANQSSSAQPGQAELRILGPAANQSGYNAANIQAPQHPQLGQGVVMGQPVQPPPGQEGDALPLTPRQTVQATHVNSIAQLPRSFYIHPTQQETLDHLDLVLETGLQRNGERIRPNAGPGIQPRGHPLFTPGGSTTPHPTTTRMARPTQPVPRNLYPSQEEILNHLNTVTRDASQEAGASAALPPGWEQATDPTTGNPYYFNRASGENTWTRPS